MLGEPVQVVAADDGDDPGHAPPVQQLDDIVEEGGSGGRRAGGPHLLQLIHDEQAGRAVGQRRERITRVLAGQHEADHPVSAVRERARSQGRHQAGADHRRLPRPAGPGQDDEVVVDQSGGEGGDELFAPVEEGRVARLVRRQPLPRAGPGGRPCRTGSRAAARARDEQGRVVREDLALQLDQLWAGIEAEVLDEHGPGPRDRGQRVARPAGGVQRAG